MTFPFRRHCVLLAWLFLLCVPMIGRAADAEQVVAVHEGTVIADHTLNHTDPEPDKSVATMTVMPDGRFMFVSRVFVPPEGWAVGGRAI